MYFYTVRLLFVLNNSNRPGWRNDEPVFDWKSLWEFLTVKPTGCETVLERSMVCEEHQKVEVLLKIATTLGKKIQKTKNNNEFS
jgi:hypothetical protein